MSDESVELVRAAYAAWNGRGVAALARVLAPGAELRDAPDMPDAATWRGHTLSSVASRRSPPSAVDRSWRVA